MKLIFEKHHHCGDFIGNAQLGATPQSCSAAKFCPDCLFDHKSPNAYQPFSFFKTNVYGQCGDCHVAPARDATAPSLRTMEGTLATLKRAFAARTKKERKRLLRSGGLRPTMETVRLAPHHVPRHVPRHVPT